MTNNGTSPQNQGLPVGNWGALSWKSGDWGSSPVRPPQLVTRNFISDMKHVGSRLLFSPSCRFPHISVPAQSDRCRLQSRAEGWLPPFQGLYPGTFTTDLIVLCSWAAEYTNGQWLDPMRNWNSDPQPAAVCLGKPTLYLEEPVQEASLLSARPAGSHIGRCSNTIQDKRCQIART